MIIWKVTIIPVTVPNKPANGATTDIILTAPIPLSIAGLSAIIASASFSSRVSISLSKLSFPTLSTLPRGLRESATLELANSKVADSRNPLGRVLKVGKDNFDKDIDTLELKLAEAIMAERPAIERGIGAVRIISVVAPLAGLLGTVTGMIVTFQMITLYGTGDPKLMAGGISQALVTTVLGLLVAIPTTLLHSFTASSARGIISTLEEQSTGILAEHSEAS